MSQRERYQERKQFFEQAMTALAHDVRFEHFIDAVREYREKAIDALSDSAEVVKSERATLACIGEIAAYKSIISVYDEFRNRAAETEAAPD